MRGQMKAMARPFGTLFLIALAVALVGRVGLAVMDATGTLSYDYISAADVPILDVVCSILTGSALVAFMYAASLAMAVSTACLLYTSVELDIPIGTMIELPRAAVTADEIATQADFFSFGTNDLTQTTFGFSRDDVEAKFIPRYLERRILPCNPFETVDAGVAALVDMGCTKGRATNPDIQLGVCGEHGGDPDSVKTFHKIGLTYVSCSPYRVPLARLAAGQAALAEKMGDHRDK